jgi:hypothetical protein
VCFKDIVSKEIKAEIGEIIFLSYFLAKRVKSQGGRNYRLEINEECKTFVLKF